MDKADITACLRRTNELFATSLIAIERSDRLIHGLATVLIWKGRPATTDSLPAPALLKILRYTLDHIDCHTEIPREHPETREFRRSLLRSIANLSIAQFVAAQK